MRNRSAAITAMGFEDSDSMDSDSWTKLLTPRTLIYDYYNFTMLCNRH